MICIRDCVRNLIELQTEDDPDSEIKQAQEKLNTLYDLSLIHIYSYMRVGDLPLEDIVNNYKGYGLPCFETIRRARQRAVSYTHLSRLP